VLELDVLLVYDFLHEVVMIDGLFFNWGFRRRLHLDTWWRFYFLGFCLNNIVNLSFVIVSFLSIEFGLLTVDFFFD
jgi:hypothetical protein